MAEKNSRSGTNMPDVFDPAPRRMAASETKRIDRDRCGSLRSAHPTGYERCPRPTCDYGVDREAFTLGPALPILRVLFSEPATSSIAFGRLVCSPGRCRLWSTR